MCVRKVDVKPFVLMFKPLTQGPRTPWIPDAGPDFMLDPRRGCNPDTGVDPDWWYDRAPSVRAKAVALCMGCPFRAECDEYATGQREAYGVWGGVNRNRDTDYGQAA